MKTTNRNVVLLFIAAEAYQQGKIPHNPFPGAKAPDGPPGVGPPQRAMVPPPANYGPPGAPPRPMGPGGPGLPPPLMGPPPPGMMMGPPGPRGPSKLEFYFHVMRKSLFDAEVCSGSVNPLRMTFE